MKSAPTPAASRMRPRILVTEPEYFTKQSIDLMKKIGVVTAKRMSRAELLRAVRDIDAIVVRIDTCVDKELLGRTSRLRCVVSATTGTNHIDVKALAARGVRLFHLHGAHSVPTAEHALALLFSAARNIPAANLSMTHGGWHRWKFIGTEMAGKTLGIFGVGKIGTEVAARAHGLGMAVIAYDPYVSAREIKKRGARKVSWKTFLKESDFISLHAPLTKETEHMFGAKEFAQMRPEMIFVNAARGGIVHPKALIAALRKGRIRAAAIDVYDGEPLAARHMLRRYAKDHSNLILTPHIAASTAEAIDRASVYSAQTLERFFKGS